MSVNNKDYISSKIRQTRRAVGISIKELARRAELHEGALGRMERGVGNPTAETIQRIADALDVHPAVFFPSSSGRGEFNIIPTNPEPLTSDGKEIPRASIQTARLCIASVLALEDICSVPKHSQMPLYLPMELTETGMAILADRVRNHFQIQAGVILDYFELLEAQGFRILLPKFPVDMSGFTFHDLRNDNAFFFLNRRKPPERQIFTLFYELGLLLIFCFLTRTMRSLNAGEVEKLARKFSAFFLMPEQAIRQSVNQLSISDGRWSYNLLLRVKTRFGVSAEAFLYRLNELKLIDPDVKESIRERITDHYRETGHKEPGKNRLPLSENGRVLDLIERTSILASASENVRLEWEEIRRNFTDLEVSD